MSLMRFGVSISSDLMKTFDQIIKKRNYANRSEAIRDLIRKSIIDLDISGNAEVVGVLSLLYDHHIRDLGEKLTGLQHDHHSLVLSSLHIHLDHQNCIEVIILKGKSQRVKQLSEALIATKGVKHGSLNLTSTGKNI